MSQTMRQVLAAIIVYIPVAIWADALSAEERWIDDDQYYAVSVKMVIGGPNHGKIKFGLKEESLIQPGQQFVPLTQEEEERFDKRGAAKFLAEKLGMALPDLGNN